MLRLSDLEGAENKIFLFYKNNPIEHLEDLKSGNLYMNNARYFIGREKEEGRKNIGDKYEGSHVFSNVRVQVFDSETDELVSQGNAGSVALRYDDDMQRPMFCMSMVTSEDFVINKIDHIKANEYKITAYMSLDEQKKKKILEEVHGDILLMGASTFLERLTGRFKEQGLTFKASKVTYDNYSLNKKGRISLLDNAGIDHFFWKDHVLSFQNEYRVVITNKLIDTPQKYNIGDLTDISHIKTVSEFVNSEYKLELYASFKEDEINDEIKILITS